MFIIIFKYIRLFSPDVYSLLCETELQQASSNIAQLCEVYKEKHDFWNQSYL